MVPLLLTKRNQRKTKNANRKIQDGPENFQGKIRYQKDNRIFSSIGEQLETNS